MLSRVKELNYTIHSSSHDDKTYNLQTSLRFSRKAKHYSQEYQDFTGETNIIPSDDDTYPHSNLICQDIAPDKTREYELFHHSTSPDKTRESHYNTRKDPKITNDQSSETPPSVIFHVSTDSTPKYTEETYIKPRELPLDTTSVDAFPINSSFELSTSSDMRDDPFIASTKKK